MNLIPVPSNPVEQGSRLLGSEPRTINEHRRHSAKGSIPTSGEFYGQTDSVLVWLVVEGWRTDDFSGCRPRKTQKWL